MHILVTGASGLLGLNFCMHFSSAHTVTGIVHSHRLKDVPFAVHQRDLTDERQTRKLIDQFKPELIVNCAALANVDTCEREPHSADLLNRELPGWLAEECQKHSLRLIHLSTDAVFDGTKEGGYLETDSPNPLSYYAKSKLQGERAVQEVTPEAILARVNFYGYSITGKRSLAEVFLKNLQAQKTMFGFTDVMFSPLYVVHLVEVLLKMAQAELQGLYHVTSPESQSKYAFGMSIAEKFDLDGALIDPISVDEADFLKASRSKNLVLNPGKLLGDLQITLPSQEEGMERFYQDHVHGYARRIYSLL